MHNDKSKNAAVYLYNVQYLSNVLRTYSATAYMYKKINKYEMQKEEQIKC